MADSESPGTVPSTEYKIPVCTGGTGGGDCTCTYTYTNSTPMPEDVGGLEAGTTFSSSTLDDILDALLYPYQEPAFTTFTNGASTTFEVGDVLAANSTFTWSTTYSANVATNSITIRDVTNAVNLVTSSANDGTEATTHGAITYATQDSHTFSISAQNTEGTTFSKTLTHYWRWRLYYGESVTTPLVEANIEALRASMLTSSFARTYSFLGGGYKYICYPSSFGTATSFIDTSTGLTVPFQASYLVSVTNTYGQTTNYRVHRSTNILGGSINIQVS
jgi:hypothetical protein